MANRTTSEKVRDVMVEEPLCVPSDTTLTEAAQRMRDADIGDLIITDGQRPRGIITDRDIVIRAVAEEHNPSDVTVSEICSGSLISVTPDDDIDRAIDLMREHAVRRLPVVEDSRLVGVLSLGDVAIERDERSVLADITAAEPNT
jgi:CBS domain-containing protein